MKRFHLFAYGSYYPGGGLADYKGSFETHAAAVNHLPTAMHEDSVIEHAHTATTNEDGSLSVVAHWTPGKGWHYKTS